MKILKSASFLALTFLVASSALAGSVDAYLKLRKANHISQAVGAEAISTFVGERTMEVAGVVKGVIKGSEFSHVVVATESGDVFIKAKVVPDWLGMGDVAARLIIKAQRTEEMGSVKAELLDCAPERDIEKYDPKPPKTAKSGKNPLNGPIGQSPKSKQEAANWNLPASDAAPYYASFIRSQNKKVSEAEAMRIAQGIIGFSLKFGVDARLIMAMVLCESNFNSREVSHTGATGLGQLMPGTAAGLGVTDSFNIEQNLYGTVKLIRGHIDKYSQTTDGDYDKLILSLAAYNAGGGAVRKYGGVPPYRETQNYVRKVMAWYNALCGR